ncbi:hypothetical protein VTK73DRAFT_6353 [Phialemonium thermophilum]|uniref:Major facilitator superfamily (MFS) profile domain-containing protein n=1 Tax=Phialemonium thermophilum TaxID=223376 RepID=A0ABR3WJP6_9PEZI
MDEMEKGQVRDVEDADRPTDSEDRNDAARAGLRLDPSGLPLSPQPSSDPMDPLNWKLSVKLVVLAEVSILSFLALLSASLITPAFVPLSEFVHRGLVPTAYVTSLFILCAGLSTIFWNPVSNVYGRRPVYILTVAVGAAMSAASGAARSYGQLLAFRCLNGFFGGVPLGLGSATVCDMFFAHERGLYMGVYTVTLITGGHVAPIIGGYIERDLTWHWCFYVPAILTGALWLLFVLTVPETLTC